MLLNLLHYRVFQLQQVWKELLSPIRPRHSQEHLLTRLGQYQNFDRILLKTAQNHMFQQMFKSLFTENICILKVPNELPTRLLEWENLVQLILT